VEVPPAKVVDLVSPAPREVILLTCVDGESPHEVKLNRDQIFKLNAQSADLLMKDFK
jgi:hypothetical protein